MKKAIFAALYLMTALAFSSCEAMEMIDSKQVFPTKASVQINYGAEDIPYYTGNMTISAGESECTDKLTIYPGDNGTGIIEYAYNGGGLLSDPYGNVYYYDAEGNIFHSNGDPTQDKLSFRPMIGCDEGAFKPMTYYAQHNGNIATFEDASSNTDIGNNQPAMSQHSQSSVDSWNPSKISEISCYGNIIWADFFPNAPNYNSRAHIEEFPLPLQFDFENLTVSGRFCGEGKNENDGFTAATGNFCAEITDNQLTPDGFGGWEFDGSFNANINLSGAVLAWVDGEQIWIYNEQSTRMDVPFHGWLDLNGGSLYTDENYPATFQFLCDLYPPERIFN
jgi:hypothetical protein